MEMYTNHEKDIYIFINTTPVIGARGHQRLANHTTVMPCAWPVSAPPEWNGDTEWLAKKNHCHSDPL